MRYTSASVYNYKYIISIWKVTNGSFFFFVVICFILFCHLPNRNRDIDRGYTKMVYKFNHYSDTIEPRA